MNGVTCGVTSVVAAFKERNIQLLSGVRKIDLSRARTREIRAIDTLIFFNVSDCGVVAGSRGPGGAARSSSWSSREDDVVIYRASI